VTSPLQRDELHAHAHLVEQVADAGVPPPPAWIALRDRWMAFLALDAAAPMKARLVSAVVDGDPKADVAVLRANAFAESLTNTRVTSAVRSAVTAKLREIYGEAAVDNYAKVATQFDDLASKFGTVAGAVDVEAPASEMVDQPDKARRAWLDGEKFAHQLSRAMGVLHAAARLCGIRESAHRDMGGRDAILLPLCCNTIDLHRRRVWEAWNATTGRCGRWSALHAANVPVRAFPANELGGFESYRPAAPMVEEWVSVARGIDQIVMHDPEDPQPAQPQPPAKKPIRQLAR
jgi:hypothetical protein